MRSFIAFLVVALASPSAMGWNECGFQVVLSKIVLKKQLVKGNPINSLYISASGSSADFTGKVAHRIAIHEDFIGKEAVFYSKPTAGEYHFTGGAECLKEKGRARKTLPDTLTIQIQESGTGGRILMEQPYDFTRVGRDGDYLAENDEVKLIYHVRRGNILVNHM